MNRFFIMIVPTRGQCMEKAIGNNGWGYAQMDNPVIYWFTTQEDAEINQVKLAAEFPNCLVTLGEVTAAVRYPLGILNKVKISSSGVLPDND